MLRFIFACLACGIFASLAATANAQVETGPDGLHIQPWFHDSAGDTRLDLMAAAAEGKDLIVLFEQRGCYYCDLLHNKNFANPELVKLITDNFLVVQMDLWGEDAVTGFDGTRMSESDLARKWRVDTTPTTIVFNAAGPSASSYQQAEVFRLPGYLESFEYFSVLDYFASKAFETQGINDFIAAKRTAFIARGIDPKAW